MPCVTRAETDEDSAIAPFPEEDSFFSFLDKPQQAISSGLRTFVTRTDEFFANEKVFYETSGSYIKLSSESVFFENGQRDHTTDIKVNIKLPATEKKISLLIESDPRQEKDEIEKALETTPPQTEKKDEYFAGVQTTRGEKKNWQFKPSAGVKIRSPIDYYLRFRLTKEVDLQTGLFNFNETLYWFDSTGTASDTSGEFVVPFNERLLFRATTGANWTEQEDLFNLRQVFSLTHTLSDRRAIAYQLGFYGVSKPAIHTTSYLLNAHYRQNLHNDYLFMSLIPQVLFQKEHDFKSEYSLTLKLEIVFHG